ncbi:hypothetical protein [Rhodococcus qingshengii]|nr:hypothetical protein [Rhodococcus qingshengii]
MRAHSRSDLHRKAAQAAAIKRAKACRHMHAPLVAATAVTVRDDGNPPAQTPDTRPAQDSVPSARRGGRIPGLVKPQPGSPDSPGRTRKVTAATAARLDRIVDGLVASYLASNGAAAVSKKVSFGAAPEAHDTLIRAYLLKKLSEVPTRAQYRVEIERQGPLLSVRVTLEPASTTAAPTKPEPAPAPHRPVTISTSAGPFEYTPPIDLHRDTYSAQEASSRLSRTGQSTSRTIAHERRKESKLLALKVANGFRFPTFQFDPRGGIHPLVERANMRLGAFNDPWGTLSWWFEDNDILDDMSPVAALAAGTLDEQLLDAALDDLTAGM